MKNWIFKVSTWYYNNEKTMLDNIATCLGYAWLFAGCMYIFAYFLGWLIATVCHVVL